MLHCVPCKKAPPDRLSTKLLWTEKMAKTNFRKDEMQLFEKRARAAADEGSAQLLLAQKVKSNLPPKNALWASHCTRRENTLQFVQISRVKLQKVGVHFFVKKLNFIFFRIKIDLQLFETRVCQLHAFLSPRERVT